MKTIKLLAVILLPIIFLLTSCKNESNPVQTPTTGTIQGKVTNSTGDSVIVGATVWTNPPTSSVTTNSSGDYSIPDVSPGQYSVTAMKGGYNPTTVIVTARAGKITTANISLNLNTIQLGLVAYYPFNGNANDESGNGKNGILYGDYQVVTGIKNEALRFIAHGSSDSLGGHVLLPNFHFTSMSSFSYALWIKEESLVDAELYISFRDDPFGIPYAGISHSPANNVIEFQVGVTSTNSALTAPFSSSYINNFVHYCLVYTNGMIKGYINGSFIGQKTQTAIVDGIYSAIARHWFNNQTSTRFTGVVDEVRVYNRALTDNEIQALYHEGE